MANDLRTIQENFIPPQTFDLDIHSARLTERQFEALCRNNSDLKLKLPAKVEFD